ncbi:MAG: helicase-exonuclease AddAB subunit AddA [Christensenellaceae bacterium]|nr:helicase-exonuclease AddAB subunit AddA [Christensenellaceae bacterium]
MPNWTHEQERAITEKGNLLVSAAAGAGKTAVMTERIARIIADGAGVDELLVVTFTNAAAAEMKQRIEKRLNELAQEEPDEEKRLRLSDAASDVGRANISTIHSFCGNVLRRNYHVAGLDPAFRTADEAEAALLRAEALDKVLEEAYSYTECSEQGADGAFGQDFLRLCDAVGRDEEISDVIIRVYDFIMARPDPLGWLEGAVEAYRAGFSDFAERAAELIIYVSRRSVKVFYSKARSLHDELLESENGRQFADMLFNDMRDLLALSQLTGYDRWCDALSDYKFAPMPRVKGGAPDSVKAYRDSVKALVKKLQLTFAEPLERERKAADALYPAMRALLELEKRFIEEYTELKREGSLIDFNDMEQLTLLVLREPEIAEEYRQKFRHIFIDEYQDTNLVQESIIAQISRGDNLFMVGDVKQSIYRFRQAEPDIFLEKYRSFNGKIGTRIDLNANFRSFTAVLNAANALFIKLMRGEVGEIDYSDNAALQAGTDTPSGEVRIELIELTDSADEGSEDGSEESNAEMAENSEVAVAEARLAAMRIKQLMETSLIYDKQAGVSRKPTFSDFAVLLRKTRGSALSWVNTLVEHGIPCTAELGDGYFEAIEVMVFMNLLRVIDNRRQDIPLMSVLRSPIAGFTEEELIHIRSDYEGDDFLTRLIAAAEDETEPQWGVHAKYFLGNIARWHSQSLLVSVDELIGQLLDETLYYTYVGVLPGGAVRQANLDLLAEKAHTYELNGSRGLYGFIRLMDSIKENISLGAAQAASVDAVRVMSIHKSKGLEFPIVFIGGMAGRFNKLGHSSAIVLDRSLGLGLRNRSGHTILEPAGAMKNPLFRRAIIAKEDEKLISEEMRILYVAMTRARERLYLLGAGKRMAKLVEEYASPLTEHRIMDAKCCLDWLLGAYFPLGLNLDAAESGVSCPVGADELRLIYHPSALRAASGKGMSRADYLAWTDAARKSEHSDEDERLNFRYPFEADTLRPSKRSVTELLDTEYEFIPAVPKFMQGERVLTGAERGTATHKLLSVLPISEMDEEAVRIWLERLVSIGRMRREEADIVNLNSVMRLLESSLWHRLIRSKRVERELEFTLLEDAEEDTQAQSSGKIVLQGIIDCCFEEDGAWVIIDYKTTSVRGTTAYEVAFRYKKQLDKYAEALIRLTGLPVKEKWVYLLSAAEAVQVDA